MEHVAARAFLDEEHEGLEDIPNNNSNNYTLGRVGKYNVIIAILPIGKYSIATIVSVAKYLLYSFTNIGIGLIVGISSRALS